MKVMIVGKIDSGKSTLTKKLYKLNQEYQKTQAISYVDKIMDTPGEYLENKFYFKALLVLSTEANVIIFVHSATDETSFFPPNFASMFNGKEVIGVVTKTDINFDYKSSYNILVNAGAKDIYLVGNNDEKTIIELRERLGITGEK